jgi:hypothetical protein
MEIMPELVSDLVTRVPSSAIPQALIITHMNIGAPGICAIDPRDNLFPIAVRLEFVGVITSKISVKLRSRDELQQVWVKSHLD